MPTDSQVELEDTNVEISQHALDRFQERYEIWRGKLLDPEEALSKLKAYLILARPEPENLKLRERTERNAGRDIRIIGGEELRYLIYSSWRFVVVGNKLVTAELKYIGSFLRPRFYQGQTVAKFFLRITEKPEGTLLEKSVFGDFWPHKTLSLVGKPEVNAVIRSLRLTGMFIDYKRTGTVPDKQAILKIRLPKSLRSFEVQEIEERVLRMLFPDYDITSTVSGITSDDLEKIIYFVTNEEWISRIIEAQRLLHTEQERIRKEEEQEQGSEYQKQQREEGLERERLKRERIQAEQKAKARAERRHSREAAEATTRRPILEILSISTDPIVVWGELKKDYRKNIKVDQLKLGKTWLIRYTLKTAEINVSCEIRDIRSLEEGKSMVIAQLISCIREEVT